MFMWQGFKISQLEKSASVTEDHTAVAQQSPQAGMPELCCWWIIILKHKQVLMGDAQQWTELDQHVGFLK